MSGTPSHDGPRCPKDARMTRKPKYALWTLLLFAGLAADSTMVSLARSKSASAANSEIYRQLDLFGEVLERVRSDYVEKPDDDKLIEAAINGMLMCLLVTLLPCEKLCFPAPNAVSP